MKALDLIKNEFHDIMTRIYTSKLSGDLSLKISSVVKSYNDALNSYHAAREKLHGEFAQKDAEGKVILNAAEQVTIIPETAEEFGKKFQEVLDKDHAVVQLTEDDIKAIPEISAAEIDKLKVAGLVKA